jgi:DNA-binding transcriptional ArsR family regulator
LKAHIYYPSRIKSEEEFQLHGEPKMSANARSLKYLLGWLIAGTRGGPTRAKIILALKESPQNANQLATMLKMDYKTMRHHLEVLEKNKIVTSVGDRYGATYFLSQMMEDNYVLFEEIAKKIGKK